MATVAANVQIGLTGGVFVAPLATALPTDTTTAKNAAFKEVGYLTEDGVTETLNDSTSTIKAWQNADTVRTVETDHSYQIKFTMLETNAVSLAQFYGAFATGTVQVKGGLPPTQEWIIEVVDGANKKRIVLPSAQVAARGDVVNKNGEAVTYPLTLECYPDATGVKAYIYYSPTPT